MRHSGGIKERKSNWYEIGQQHRCSEGAPFMYHPESGASASGPRGNQLASSAAEIVTRVSQKINDLR